MIKSTGITRKIDDLGRIVLPKELRENFMLEENAVLEIFTDKNKIVLQKYSPGCLVTGNTEDLIEYNGLKISRHVVRELSELLALPMCENVEKPS
ncbi:MAG: AbrB/MazE/SpoVT family DNA-binding domain-containing protein [Defluviitaleaceae bacterium]|nr:AbrB/MazE/SpoVT family DNA-binding domain-containing protein [Defluviitaleaceae bacterium]